MKAKFLIALIGGALAAIGLASVAGAETFTCPAPNQVAANGSPQALTWNMGTTSKTRSDSDCGMAKGSDWAMVWRKIERWL